MKIHHIGYIVSDMELSIREFQTLGYLVESPPIEDTLRDIVICFLKNDGYRIEIITPLSENSSYHRMLKKYSQGPYHLCYECKNLDEFLESSEAKNYVLIQKPMIAPAIHNKRVAFLMSRQNGMIELLETVKQC